jgi:hypothetical protein
MRAVQMSNPAELINGFLPPEPETILYNSGYNSMHPITFSTLDLFTDKTSHSNLLCTLSNSLLQMFQPLLLKLTSGQDTFILSMPISKHFKHTISIIFRFYEQF